MKGTKVILTILTFILFLALGIAAPASDTEQPLKVFILIGASNMMGFGANVGQLPPELKRPQKDVLVYQDDAWGPLNPGKWGQAGPEHSFAQAMVKYFGEPVGIIKVVAGRNIRKGDTKKYPQTLAKGWVPETPDGVYSQLVELVKEAGKSRPIIITGIVWDVSGRDTVKEVDAKAYPTNLTRLIECMRGDFGNPALPFVCALDNTHPGKPEGFPFMDMVREAQKSLKVHAFRAFDQNDLPRVMDTAKEDYNQRNDHFTTASEVESGKRYAAAMVDLLNQVKGLPAAKPTPPVSGALSTPPPKSSPSQMALPVPISTPVAKATPSQTSNSTMAMRPLASLSAVARTAGSSARPNIILVVADDMSWSDTGYSGSTKVKTPNLDDMVRQGVEFDYCFAAHQASGPARFAILSGRDPMRTGLFMSGLAPRPTEIHLPSALKQVGYKSAHFGKTHIGEGGSGPGPGDLTLLGMGFDEVLWHSNTAGLDVKFYVNDTKTVVETKGDGSIATMNLALDYIRKHAKSPEPFFVQICFVAPHTCEFGKYAPEYQGWAGQISALDTAVGNLRAELRKLGLADNTIVWFIADNASGADRGVIASRIPSVLEWPAHIKKAVKTNVVTGEVDIYPTLLEAAGVKGEKEPILDGISLVPLIDGMMAERSKPLGFLFWKIKNPNRKEAEAALLKAELFKEPQAAWIDGKYELVVGFPLIQWPLADMPNRPSGGPFLYDIYADPTRKTNLAPKEPERVQKMEQALDTWRMSVRASLDGVNPAKPEYPPASK